MHVDRSITLASGSGAAAAARRFVRAGLREAGASVLMDEAVLLASELVTNALLHAGPGTIGLRLLADPSTCRVEVSDTSTIAPTTKHYSAMASTGRGLQMIERLSTGWGTSRTPDGKTVWFELGAGTDRGASALRPAHRGER